MNDALKSSGHRWLLAAVVWGLAGCATTGREDAPGVPMEQRTATSGAAAIGQPGGWPEAVPLPEGAQIDGYRCANRHCTLWFGLMTLDEAMALKRGYIQLLKDSGRWEQLGSPNDQYEEQAFHYTGATPSGCGYTLLIRQGSIPNDLHHRWRVSTSLTW